MKKEIIEDDDVVGGDTGDVLVEEVKLTVDKGQSPVRIDKFIHNFLGNNVSRTKIQAGADAGNILVNGKPVKSNYKVRPQDEILLLLPKHSENYDLVAEDIPLDIVYEDDDLLVINKSPEIVVHPGLGNYRGTLINAVLGHFKDLPKGKEDFRPGLVHRLDKGTSGLIVMAKTDHALAHLAKQFFDRKTKRKYIALVWGDVAEEEGTINIAIGRDTRERRQMQVYPEGEGGKHAITHYKVVERLNYVTVVECRLETGRTHQIRVHMKHIGHTLFNDTRYGGNRILKGTVYAKYKQFIDNCFEIMPRQALHAATLGFKHPVTGEEMFFEAPLPPEFESVLSKWRKYWSNPNQEVAGE
ncbi:MAG TPA: RluA family pseudouridine synthase [Chitinophagales bacterium]|nr:RluA family pseudouridine synthase [Chitinophagales bacterium]